MPKYDLAWMERVGPIWDAVCGTEGDTTDLNALFAAGKKRILLGEGAVLTASYTIPVAASHGFLFAPRHVRSLNLGAFGLFVDASFFHLEGFLVSGAPDTGIQLTTNANGVSLSRVGANSCGSHGLQINNSFNDHTVEGCYFSSNTGDGMKIAAGATNARIINNFSWNNTGYGLNDQSNSAIVVANRLNGNTAGAINGTPAIDVGNLKT